jgi:spore germination protein YaaH
VLASPTVNREGLTSLTSHNLNSGPCAYNAHLLRRALLVAALVLVGSAPNPVGAAALTPTTAPQGMHALEDAMHASDRLSFADSTTVPIAIVPRAASAQLRREVLGFAPYWNLNHYAEWNYSLMSTVAYFGLTVNTDGTFATQGGGWDGWNSSDLTNMINLAHGAGARVVLVIKDFNDGSINKIVTTSAMQSLIDGTMAAIGGKSLDGVNVDFEPSGSSLYPDIPLGLVNLMTAMSSQVHTRYPGSEVSIDTYAGAASCTPDPSQTCSFRIPLLAPVVDAMFVMAYDSVFSNMPGQAGPNSPLNGWTFNDTVDVAQYLAQAPASKIILGVPYYGYKWRTVDGSPNSTAVGGGVAESYSGVLKDLSCGHVAMVNGWDGVGQSPYASWWSPSVNDPCGDNLRSPQELYYDNATSLGLKYDLVNANNLRGTGMWALGYDTGSNDLWNELAVKFTTTTPWYPLGGVATSSPGASSWGPTRTDVFVRGGDNGLWQESYDGTTWSGWTALGGGLTSAPAAASWGSNRIDTFVRGTDNALWHKWYDTTGWHGWERLGGSLISGPAVASWGPGRLDVFVVGTDHGLWHKWWDGKGWSGWEPLGGVLTSDPATISWGSNRLDVFARGSDNALWHKWWDTAGWHAWERLGGYLTSGPAAASCAAGHMDVFALGGDGAVYQMGYTGSWAAWQRLGGQWSFGPGAVCPSGATAANLFARGPESALWWTSIPGS